MPAFTMFTSTRLRDWTFHTRRPKPKSNRNCIRKWSDRRQEAPAPVVSFIAGEEMAKASRSAIAAHQLVKTVMQDVRLGKAVQLEQIEPVVENITESILRNSGALMACWIKNKDDYIFCTGQRVHLDGCVLPFGGAGRRNHASGRSGRIAARHRQGTGAG